MQLIYKLQMKFLLVTFRKQYIFTVHYFIDRLFTVCENESNVSRFGHVVK